MHLHGHDFSIIGEFGKEVTTAANHGVAAGNGPWDGSVITQNPPRRDVAMVPANGHLVLAFQTSKHIADYGAIAHEYR